MNEGLYIFDRILRAEIDFAICFSYISSFCSMSFGKRVDLHVGDVWRH